MKIKRKKRFNMNKKELDFVHEQRILLDSLLNELSSDQRNLVEQLFQPEIMKNFIIPVGGVTMFHKDSLVEILKTSNLFDEDTTLKVGLFFMNSFSKCIGLKLKIKI